MDRKLFLSYIQNMQQNNQDMTGFQNSMRKNSWQKPKSLYEMNGGGHVNQPAFDVHDAAKQLGRDADKRRSELSDTSLEGVRKHLKGIAAKAHQEFLDNDGTGNPIGSYGKEEIHDILANDDKIGTYWRRLSADARDAAISEFGSHLRDIHNSYVDSTIAQHGPDEDEEEMKVNALHQQGKFLPKMP